MKPAVKPRNRPHFQCNSTSRGDENQLNEQTQMVNLRNNRRSLDCTQGDYRTSSGDSRTVNGDPRDADGGKFRAGTAGVDSRRSLGTDSRIASSGAEPRAPEVPGTSESRVAASSEYRPPREYRSPFGAYKPPPPQPVPSDYKGGSEYPNNNINTNSTTYGTNMASGGAPKPAIRPHKASVSDLDNPSGNPDSGNIRGYLTRPWNSENRPPQNDTQQRSPAENQNSGITRSGQPGNIRRYPTASWNSSTEQEPTTNSNAHRNRTLTNNDELSQSQHSMNMLSQSQHSVNDTVDLNETTDLVRSRRNSDDSVSDYGLRRTSSVQAKRKFMMGSYIILFIGILLAVSGAVLTVLAFHNHFGHISIGQQWSLAGIVLMTIGICLLLTYTVTAAKNVSVCPQWGICPVACCDTPPPRTRGKHPQADTTPWADTPQTDTPLGRHPLGRPPPLCSSCWDMVNKRVKYWAIQEDIHMENRGNYSRNLEQSSSVYIPAPYTRESRSEPPGGYYRATESGSGGGGGGPGGGGTGYYRLTRESPSLHSSAAASTSQFTETSSVDLDEEPRRSVTPSHKRTKRKYNPRYDVAGHEVESDTQSEGSLHTPGEREGQGRGDGGYRGRALRPAPGAPKATKIARVPDPMRSAPRVPVSTRVAKATPGDQEPKRLAPGTPEVLQPTRAAPAPPISPEHDKTAARNPKVSGTTHSTSRAQKTPANRNSNPGVPDLIRTVSDHKAAPQQQQGQKRGTNPGQSPGQDQQELKLRPAPVLPEIARQARMSQQPVRPQKVDLGDLPPHSETAVPLNAVVFEYTGGPQIEMEKKKKGPLRPSPPNGGSKSQETQLNGKDSVVVDNEKQAGKKPQGERSKDNTARKPSRPAPDAPVSGTSDTVNIGGMVAHDGGRDRGKAKPTPAARMSKTFPIQQEQDYCCIEGTSAAAAGGARPQCQCAAGDNIITRQGVEEGSHAEGGYGNRVPSSPRDGGHEGPYTGSSDDELAADGPSQPGKPKPPNVKHKKTPPPTMKKPTLSYENLTPPEEGAPPAYADSLKLPKK